VNHRALIGLTGGIGSGKSTVADAFAALGAGVVDTDQIAHRLTAPDGAAMPAIVAAFGPTIVGTTGAMDRTAMRRLVFSDPLARRRLEAILHPMIGTETTHALEAVDGPYRIVDVTPTPQRQGMVRMTLAAVDKAGDPLVIGGAAPAGAELASLGSGRAGVGAELPQNYRGRLRACHPGRYRLGRGRGAGYRGDNASAGATDAPAAGGAPGCPVRGRG
jgi:hypothetical protein